MQLSDILNPLCIKIPLNATNKLDAITQMVNLLVETGLVADRQAALKAVLDRETVRSTGVGQRFAIPHGKTTAIDELVMAVGKTATPIEFNSIDGQPVELIFMLLSPIGRPGPHIQALAKISRLMTDPVLHDKIWAAPNAIEMYNLLVNNRLSS